MRAPIRLLLALLLGLSTALLVSCGGSGKGLIPAANAGPLQGDFEAVAQAALAGNGNCTATAAAIRKTNADFLALPTSVDHGLRETLRKGIANLRTRALVECEQPAATITTSTPTTTQTTTTQTTSTQTTPIQTTPTSTETTPITTTPEQGGGTPAPGGGGTPGGGPGRSEENHGNGSGDAGQGGGTSAGEDAGGAGSGEGAGGQGAGR